MSIVRRDAPFGNGDKATFDPTTNTITALARIPPQIEATMPDKHNFESRLLIRVFHAYMTNQLSTQNKTNKTIRSKWSLSLMSKSPTKAGDLFRYLSSDLILKFKNDTAGNCLLTRWCHKSELESIKTTECKDGHIVGCKCLGFFFLYQTHHRNSKPRRFHYQQRKDFSFHPIRCRTEQRRCRSQSSYQAILYPFVFRKRFVKIYPQSIRQKKWKYIIGQHQLALAIPP